MFETARYESERRLPAAAVISLALSAFAAMVLLIAPGIIGEIDVDALLADLPPALVESMGLQHMGTIEGFLALELYQFVWVLGLGAYVAYSAASTIAGDVEDGRMDTLLAAPVSRRRLLLEKYLALLSPVVVVNVVVFCVVAAGTAVIGEPVALADLVAVHALSMPYFMACGAAGMVASVAAPRRLVAEGVAAGAVVGTFLLQSLTTGTSAEWLGSVAPMRYYDPLAVLTASEYDPVGAGILLAAAAALLAVAVRVFEGADVQ
mgnify:FL=1